MRNLCTTGKVRTWEGVGIAIEVRDVDGEGSIEDQVLATPERAEDLALKLFAQAAEFQTDGDACRWCGAQHAGACVFEEIAHAFYDTYFAQLGRPDITWETFALGDHVLFATALRLAIQKRRAT